ncbi:Phosphodiest-domain-containing protein [Hygrophoropsis aurantiaca]|uniref:Phosphodiest-domain-containing protein n=1 Tax=Hygrophoropsis aurantiaca TaxID=72124 RepID=A0ACB7ZZT4_9AGAM|nr:Phosphodiest-domain-containing protein [Hygrophoropsis aurantiaca]
MNYNDDKEQQRAAHRRSRRPAFVLVVCLAVLSLPLLLIPNAVPQLTNVHTAYHNHDTHYDRDTLFSNGTHAFRRTVLLVSIDGLRADYLDRGFTPHLTHLAARDTGIRAEYMRPIFPTLTFPNHWTLMTGLYAESHGVIGNTFYDPVSNDTFHYNVAESAAQAHWWEGEPMWETAERAGVKTANLMWPGPPHTQSGASSTYHVSWKDRVPLSNKLDQLLAWIDLPFEERPQLLLAYEPSLDQAGHATGPGSARVNATLHDIDIFTSSLTHALAARNLSRIVDVVFVSDHGMADTDTRKGHVEWVVLDGPDVLGGGTEEAENKNAGWDMVTHRDGYPAIGLRFAPQANTTRILERLLAASLASAKDTPDGQPKFDVWTAAAWDELNANVDELSADADELNANADELNADADESEGGGNGNGNGNTQALSHAMPTRYHFSSHVRISPLWVIPRMGYALTTRADGKQGMTPGNHGYDNNDPSMRAIFVAHGPFSVGARAALAAKSKGVGGKGMDTRTGDIFTHPAQRPLWEAANKDAVGDLVKIPVGDLAMIPADDQAKVPAGDLVMIPAGDHAKIPTGTDDQAMISGFDNVELYNLVLTLLGIEDWAARTNGTEGFWEKYLV